jgi:hypothetical protein
LYFRFGEPGPQFGVLARGWGPKGPNCDPQRGPPPVGTSRTRRDARPSRKGAAVRGLTPAQRYVHERTFDFDNAFGTDPPPRRGLHTAAGLEVVERSWRKYGRAILEACIAERPGTRPSSWWTFDAPAEPRKRTGGKGKAIEGDPCRYFGRPSSYHLDSYDHADPPRFESQRSYLTRLGLLARSELRVDDDQGEHDDENISDFGTHA